MADLEALAEWLRARWDEAEAAALKAWPSPWEASIRPGMLGDIVDVLVPFRPDDPTDRARTGLMPAALLSVTDGKTCLFFVRNQPSAVLADLASKRALLDDLLGDEHADWCSAVSDLGCDCHPGRCDCGRDDRVLRRLRILARPHAGDGTPDALKEDGRG